MMKAIFQKIWDLAFTYQDKRDDLGHAGITLGYAEKLVKLENGDEDVVIPAIILHDIGWSQLSKSTISVFFNTDTTKDEIFSIRLQHQVESVRLAKGILTDVGYSPDLSKEILEIISEHDTRKGFISKNEGLVRDADKLWRFSKIGFEADIRRFQLSNESLCNRLEAELKNEDFIYSKSAKQMALKELKLRRIKS
jgi:HD superfamily phosphodiesterase